jgi:uncharacterized protein
MRMTEPNLADKMRKLKEILKSMNKVLVAFSGGVDSSFLLKMAKDSLGEKDVLAVTATSPLYPQRELELAKKIVKEIGVRHILIESNELKIGGFSDNPIHRCYLCKKGLFSELRRVAEEEGFFHIVEGSTLDDERDHRPGKMAIKELGIRSPLKEALFSKNEVREASKELGLSNWDKPSFACLASRFPYHSKITEEELRRVEEAEEFLIGLGFKQVRVRHYRDLARIELYPEEIDRLMGKSLREKVVNHFKKIGYKYVTLDLQGFRSGSMNEVLS